MKIEDIPDPVFAQKMMGEGFGINPTEGEVVAQLKARSTMSSNKACQDLKQTMD